MKLLPIALVTLCLMACTNPGARAPGAGTAAAGWADFMSDLDATMGDIKTGLVSRPQGDLDAIAAGAERAAAGMAKGYGEYELTDVPGFARFARDAEAWLLQIAVEARQGRGELAADVFRSGVKKHCNECHDADEQAHR